jgi:DNA-binding LacI/PurR family transcriptional regulator
MVSSGPPARRPRITEVAAAAGVSITTVSHALNGKGRISEATRTHVHQVARELGYRPSANARSLGSGRHGLLALKVSLPGSSAAAFVEFDYFTRLLNAATSTALQNGFALVTLPSGEIEQEPPDFSADGMIAVDPEQGDEALATARKRGLPIVTAGRDRDDGASPWIDNDHRHGTITALNHLAARGARRIALIGIERVNSFAIDAAAAYEEWCAKHSVEPIESQVVADYSEAAGRAAALELLSAPNPPDAIYALLDGLGLGALSAARELGLRVPDDLLLAACTDSASAATSNPGLTSLSLAPEEIGTGAVEMLLKMLDGSSATVPNRYVATKLVIRQSSSPAA